MPVAYAYVRVTFHDLAEDGKQLHLSKVKAFNYFERELEPKGYTWGGVFVEEFLEFRKMLSSRPAARELFDRLLAGDFVIFPEAYHAFLTPGTFLFVSQALGDREVGFEFLDPPLDRHRKDFTIEEVADYFHVVRTLGSREKLAQSRKRRRDLGIAGRPPYGWERKRTAAGRYELVPIPKEQDIVDLIVGLIEAGRSRRDVQRALFARGLKNREGRHFTFAMINRIYEREKARVLESKGDSHGQSLDQSGPETEKELGLRPG